MGRSGLVSMAEAYHGCLSSSYPSDLARDPNLEPHDHNEALADEERIERCDEFQPCGTHPSSTRKNTPERIGTHQGHNTNVHRRSQTSIDSHPQR